MPGDELKRIREYEKQGNLHLEAAQRALKQFQVSNAPLLKYLDAVDLWDKAGKCFTIAGEYEDASDAFSKGADCLMNIGKPHEAAVFSLRSAEMMRRVDIADAVDHYENAISMYCEIGRFFTAANIAVGVAELFEEDRNVEEAMNYYKQAADYYRGEGYRTPANVQLLKVAHNAALLERFDFATESFEAVIIDYMDDNLKRLNVKDLFLRAGLCQLANGGSIHGGLASHKVLQWYMAKWKVLDYQFEQSREYTFFENMLLIIPKADLGNFADHVYQLDSVVGFDSWCLRLLKRVKEDISEEIHRREDQKDLKERRDKLIRDIRAGNVSKAELQVFDDANKSWGMTEPPLD